MPNKVPLEDVRMLYIWYAPYMVCLIAAIFFKVQPHLHAI